MGKPGGTRNDRKKLSWTYRNKKRLGQTRKQDASDDKNVQVQNKKARIIVRNLSFKVTEEDVRNLYKPFGEIEQIDLLKRPDGKPVGCGFVQFKRIEDASKAIFQTNKQELLGRPVNVTWAIAKSKFVEQLNQKNDTKVEDTDETEEKQETEEPDVIKFSNERTELPEKIQQRKERKKLTPDERKLKKLEKRKKRARIVVRNLSFKTTEKHLREHFSQYGNIEEIKLLTKSDGKRVGCGFVQFEHVQSAAKAIHYSNLKTLLDRQIVVDWALSKNKFNEVKQEVEVKEEKEDIQLVDDDDDDDVKPVIDDSIKEESQSDDDDNEDQSSDDEDNQSSADSQEEEEEEEEEEEKPIKTEFEKRPRVFSHDVNEGKTVFLKNVPFSVKNEELRECMEQFGPVYYALVCMDSLTEHSKGTAFVKFVNVDDAEKCLSSGTELQLHGQTLDPHRAIDRKDVQNSKNQPAKQNKDSRNLYLVKEGVILAGSPAAADVSASDMAKRLQMEQWKSQMLRNLNMFVSRVRLVVHNLPPTMDDLKLREIFKKYAGTKAVINEARVMRDLKNPDGDGVGKSKEFGFVGFTNHEDALQALRSINNNPNIFSKGKRPIVAFSIENRVMVNAKARRVQKSRDNNPLWKGKRNETGGDDGEKSDGPAAKRFRNSETFKNRDKNWKNQQPQSMSNEEIPEFSGVTSKFGERKMRSKFNLKNQAQLHAKTKKDEKKHKKIQRKFVEKKIDEQKSRREIKPKQGSKKLSKEEANLDRLVENYRSRLSGVSTNKSKWYNT